MANINDVLINIQDLTNKNLKILEALNDSFYTTREHISLELNNSTYTLPSFISLENKINTLSDNFYNLINAPKTGEAAFVFDSGTQKIQMKSFTNTPLPLDTPTLGELFEVEQNDVLKDFLTPMPYVKWDISSLPADIKYINVKKLIPKNDILRNRISSLTDITYGNVYKTLADMTEDTDYVVYDTLVRCPLKNGIADGEYTIASVSDKTINTNLDEFYTIKLNENLTYKIKNGTIQKDMKVGDKLVTVDDKTGFEIIELSKEKKELYVQVLGGAYYDLTVYDPVTNLDSSKLRILQETTELSDSYLKIPLEEDSMIVVFVAPVNELNVQAPWSNGLIINTDNLSTTYNDVQYRFRDFYNIFVNNIGDTLMEVSAMMSNYLNNYTKAEWDNISSMKPTIDPDCLKIVPVSTHFATSEPVEKIRKLYQQINDVKQQISAQVAKVAALNQKAASTTYSASSGISQLTQANIASANTELTNLRNTECALEMELSTTANSITSPIEEDKYRIRGYFDYDSFQSTNSSPDIVKIELQYRYRTTGQYADRSLSLNNGKFIYSEWISMDSPYRKKLADNDGFRMVYELEPNNNLNDEPSWNQIDIPISQGEYVEMKLRVLYDLGRPFVEAWSDWSDTIEYTFPAGFVFQKSINSIIKENNEANYQNMINNTLSANGITNHVSNQVPSDGSGIVYYHQPDNIASGFRNESTNQVISLRDKLFDMTNKINELETLVLGLETPIEVSIAQGANEYLISPYNNNTIIVPNYDNNPNQYDDKWRFVQYILRIKNISQSPVRLYSLFRGPSGSELIDTNIGSIGDINDYIYAEDTLQLSPKLIVADEIQEQVRNQVLYFRVRDAYDHTLYYGEGNQLNANNKLCGNRGDDNANDGYIHYISAAAPTEAGAMLYPVLKNISDISIPANSTQNYYKLNIGESLEIPLTFDYYLTSGSDGLNKIEKTIAIDLKYSLYQDTVNYKILFKATKQVQSAELIQDAITADTITYNSVIGGNTSK